MKAILLAAGRGERFRPHSEKLPKPCMPFLNIPLMFYPWSLIESEVDTLVVNLHHHADIVKGTARSYECSQDLLFSDETKELLGSGGGLIHAQAQLAGKNFIYTNADEILLVSNAHFLKEMIQLHEKLDSLATLLCIPHPEAGKKFGAVWTDHYNSLLSIGKQTHPEAERSLHFCGIQILSSRIFDYLPKKGASSIFQDGVLPGLAKGEKATAYEADCMWQEAGNVDDYLTATRVCIDQLKEGPWQQKLRQLLNKHTPGWTLENSCLKHPQSKIESNTEIKGFAVIGKDCSIGENSIIENSVIAPGAKIPPQSHIHNRFVLG